MERSGTIKGGSCFLGLVISSLPEQFSVEQKPKYNGLDHEWERRKQTR